MSSTLNLFSKKLPVIAVCGSTGTGKSKLAIDLAFLLKGEVINADAVQLYKGLDIATNKVTVAESKEVRHQLLSFLDPVDGFRYNIHKYRRDCWRIIEENRDAGRLPIVCGGTHYYIEAVLWNDFLNKNASTAAALEYDETEEDKEKGKNSLLMLSQHSWPTDILRQLPTDPKDYYGRLRQLDPATAKGLHPNDTRKLQQALLSAIQSNQHRVINVDQIPTGDTGLPNNRSYSPRFTPLNAIIWLDCELDVLRPKLDARVIDMIDRGLLEELEDFLTSTAKSLLPNQPVSCDGQLSDEAKREIFVLANEGLLPSTGVEHWCRGILQSIGFKEFEAFLQLSLENRKSETGKETLATAIAQIQIATRQYARHQRRWITKRFLERPVEGSIPVYRLDVTNIIKAPDKITAEALWTSNILNPALQIVASISPELSASRLVNEQAGILAVPTPEPFTTCSTPKPSTAGPFICSACGGRVFVELNQWQDHLKSRAHKKRLASLHKLGIKNKFEEKKKKDIPIGES